MAEIIPGVYLSLEFDLRLSQWWRDVDPVLVAHYLFGNVLAMAGGF